MTARGEVKISGRLSGSLYHPNWRNNRKLTLITHFALVSQTVIAATIYGPLGGRHDGEPTRRDVDLFCFSSVPASQNGRQTNVNFVPQFRTTCRPRTRTSRVGQHYRFCFPRIDEKLMACKMIRETPCLTLPVAPVHPSWFRALDTRQTVLIEST